MIVVSSSTEEGSSQFLSEAKRLIGGLNVETIEHMAFGSAR